MDTTGRNTGSRGGRALRSFLLLAVFAASLAWAMPSGVGRASAAPGRPNIVLILTDDQRWDTLDWMPNVHRLLVDKGVTFTNAFVSNSTCCPSRTTILTGQYSHMTGVWSNDAPYGGFGQFHDGSTIATWLHDAGYQTALVGKYLNWYRTAALHRYVPPGWDDWVAFAEDNGKHTDYDLTINGAIEPHHDDPMKDFSTDVLANKAIQFIHGAHGPFFLYFAPFAPHAPYNDVPDKDECPALSTYDSVSYGEADVSDKPQYVRSRPWSSVERSHTAAVRAGQCQLLTGVDRAVARIVSALASTGRLSNTMIMFMSDNGYMWGEHRLFDKAKPYDEAIRIPMVIRYDPLVSAPRTESKMVDNLDVAPTFTDLAGVSAPGAVGRSLLPLVAGEDPAWRSDFLLEHSHDTHTGDHPAPDYCGVRSTGWMYTMYAGGGEELYNLQTDSGELRNLADLPSATTQRSALRAKVIRECDPLPPRFPER